MKTVTFITFLRPAILSDIFDQGGNGSILENKEIFYKEASGEFRGPYKLTEPFPNNMQVVYKELLQHLSTESILIVDPKQYSESVFIKLKLKQVEEEDILQNNKLIVNTAFFKRNGATIDGPFYIKNNTLKSELHTSIKNKNLFVFNSISNINKFQLEQPAIAV